MLALTENAATAIRTMVETSDLPDGGLRIATRRGDNGSQALEVVVTSAPEPSDQVVEEEDARVFLEEPVAAVLEDKVLDARLEDTGVRFYVLSEHPS